MFENLNKQLAEVWSSIVQDIRDQLQCQVDLIELAIDWYKVHMMLLDGLHSMAFQRYLSWFGKERYLKLKAEMQGAETHKGHLVCNNNVIH